MTLDQAREGSPEANREGEAVFHADDVFPADFVQKALNTFPPDVAREERTPTTHAMSVAEMKAYYEANPGAALERFAVTALGKAAMQGVGDDWPINRNAKIARGAALAECIYTSFQGGLRYWTVERVVNGRRHSFVNWESLPDALMALADAVDNNSEEE